MSNEGRAGAAEPVPQQILGPAFALRKTFKTGYRLVDLQSDLMAGLVVAVVALPLSMALGIASGVPPQYGLYTAIVAGFVIALLGGSKFQVSGPTAAFVVLLAPVSARFGVGGLMLASLLAGVMLMLMGMARMGRLIEFIPYPVTTGFTAGIGVVIATIQLKDFLGLTIEQMPVHYLEKVFVLAKALPTAHWPDLAIGALTLLALVFWPRVTKRVPAPLVALPLAVTASLLLGSIVPGFRVDTIISRFPETNGIPQAAPKFVLPWMMPGADGEPIGYKLELFQALLGSAFAIAILGAIESLLSAVVADGMTGKKHDPDAELMAQGTGNIIAPFFGGFAATGAIARTTTNIRSGARSPIAAMSHAVFVLLIMLLAAPLIGLLPMASLAAMLLVVAWNMSEIRHVLYMLRVAPKHDVLVLLTCFSLTVIFDMVVSVTAGVVLAALLFMKRMSEVSAVSFVGRSHPEARVPLPESVQIYDIAGPLFFGAAQRAMSALKITDSKVRVMIFDLTDVPVMDATGLVALQSVLDYLHAQRKLVVIGGVRAEVLELMARAGWKHREWLVIYRSMSDALAFASMLGESDLEHVHEARRHAAESVHGRQ